MHPPNIQLPEAELFDAFLADPIHMDRVFTQIKIVQLCCLDIVSKQDRACLIVMAEEGKPLLMNSGMALTVLMGSSFPTLIEAAAGAETSLPTHGGYYARSVHVHQLSDGTPVDFDCSMMLMRTLWSSPNVEPQQDRKARLLSCLRKAKSEGHTVLVLGAWGLLGHVSPDEVDSISDLMKDVLGSSDGDVARSFVKIIIACKPASDFKVLKAMTVRLSACTTLNRSAWRLTTAAVPAAGQAIWGPSEDGHSRRPLLAA